MGMVDSQPYSSSKRANMDGTGDEEKRKGSHPPFVLCLIQPDRNSHPRMVSSSPRIKSLSSPVFLVPAQSSLTSTLTVVKLIKA